MRLTRRDIDALERRERAALITSISGVKPACLVGTADTSGRGNLAIFSSLLHIGSNPPLLGLIFRPDSVERHTLENIRATGIYTVNHVHEAIIDAAHQTAARYPREVSEFIATGLAEHREPGFAAPFVAEARVRLALRLCEEHTLSINGTHLVIGEVLSIEVPDSCRLESGAIDPARAGCVAVAGLDSYYRPELLQRMTYAKPGQSPQRVDEEPAAPAVDRDAEMPVTGSRETT